MKEYKKMPPLNIQLFADGGNGDPAPAPQSQDPNPNPEPNPAPNPAPTPNPEPTPQPQEWQINHTDYEGLGEETVATYVEHGKKNGWSEEYVKNTLAGRASYLSGEREKMTPDMRAYDTNISNFLSGVTDAEERGVYERLAENAAGRKILVEKILSGKPSPGSGNPHIGGNIAMTKDEFIDKYNEAKNLEEMKKDSSKLRELENYARNSQDTFYKDFLGL